AQRDQRVEEIARAPRMQAEPLAQLLRRRGPRGGELAEQTQLHRAEQRLRGPERGSQLHDRVRRRHVLRVGRTGRGGCRLRGHGPLLQLSCVAAGPPPTYSAAPTGASPLGAWRSRLDEAVADRVADQLDAVVQAELLEHVRAVPL